MNEQDLRNKVQSAHAAFLKAKPKDILVFREHWVNAQKELDMFLSSGIVAHKDSVKPIYEYEYNETEAKRELLELHPYSAIAIQNRIEIAMAQRNETSFKEETKLYNSMYQSVYINSLSGL